MNANAFWNHLVAQEPCNIVEYKWLYSIDQFWYIKIHTWLRGLGEYCWAWRWFLLFYFPKPRCQVWSLIYRKWSIKCLSVGNDNGWWWPWTSFELVYTFCRTTSNTSFVHEGQFTALLTCARVLFLLFCVLNTRSSYNNTAGCVLTVSFWRIQTQNRPPDTKQHPWI